MPPQARRAILTLLCLAVLMVQVDTSVVNLAVHAIGVALQAPLTTLQWTVDGYNLFPNVGGMLADLFGRRRMLRLGAELLTWGSAVSGLAPDPMVWISGRMRSGSGPA